MKIALLGYGKMGKAIEMQAVAKGHDVVLKVDADNTGDLTPQNLGRADVAIEFSTPETGYDNIHFCLKHGTPVVSGTTGWLDRMEEVTSLCKEKGGAFFYASNYSVGVNILFALNRHLARIMNRQPQYEVSVAEIHHIHKVDAPSGTAITLAQGLIEELESKNSWINQKAAQPDEVGIVSDRIAETPGTHEVMYTSSVDRILIRHEAYSREGFAAGALMAAEWLIGKQGVFGMADLLDL